jgi:hypothetical protein
VSRGVLVLLLRISIEVGPLTAVWEKTD